MKKLLIALAASAAAFAGVSAAQADSLTNTLTVRATLTNGCNINFKGGKNVFDFGPVNDLLNNPKYQDESFTIKCTNDLKNEDGSADTNTYGPTSVSLNGGAVASSTVQKRLLANVAGGTDTLDFQVYKGEPGTTIIWGDQPGGATDSGTVYATPDQNTTYPFRIALLSQDIKGKTAGRYENVMTATVNYTATPARP